MYLYNIWEIQLNKRLWQDRSLIVIFEDFIVLTAGLPNQGAIHVLLTETNIVFDSF